VSLLGYQFINNSLTPAAAGIRHAIAQAFAFTSNGIDVIIVLWVERYHSKRASWLRKANREKTRLQAMDA
jgi:hypothetical protein